MQLRDYLDKHPISVVNFAKKLGISYQAVYRYLSDGRIPAPMIAARISRATGGLVQPNDLYGISSTPKPRGRRVRRA